MNSIKFTLTWDDIYTLGDRADWDLTARKVRDNAQRNIRDIILERTDFDINTVEDQEQFIKLFIEKTGVKFLFDLNGCLVRA